MFLKTLEVFIRIFQYIMLIIVGIFSVVMSIIQNLVLESQVIGFNEMICWISYYHRKIGCLYLSFYFRLKYNKKMMFYQKQDKLTEILINGEKYYIPINPNDHKIKIDFFDKKLKLTDITIINRILKIF